jgi:uncharacterized membrane protein YqgA involved in biofilm formation
MEGWLMRTEEGRKLAEFFDSALIFLACCLGIGVGMVALITFRPEIRAALRAAEIAVFG